MKNDDGKRQLALVLGGGGARAAYQAGVIHYMHDLAPDISFPVITGVSAGAINAAFLAGNSGLRGAEALMKCWSHINQDKVFEAESSMSFIRRVLPGNLFHNPVIQVNEGEAILNTQPLRQYLSNQLPAKSDGSLPQITQNIDDGGLTALCITTTSFTTGQSVSWVQGRSISEWERPNRVAHQGQITLDHVMASSSLPLLFPAVKLRGAWYGDGGIRLIAPLSPALHLGATDIICISPKHMRTQSEASQRLVHGYPPAAQVMGIMLNATFLDAFDHDVQMANRITKLALHTPKSERNGIRPVNTLLIQPSKDIGKLARGFDIKTRGVLRMLTRGLGSGETLSPDWLSVILFDPGFIHQVLELGYEDGWRYGDNIKRFIESSNNA
ncbi:MAG: patatin-like phospholipase family protein [Bacteroidetes bacterium]|nr:patatin-like phospholipase family protein [Bacteroidota bacterium]